MRAQDEALRRGVTGVESLEQASSYAALRRARARDALRVRVLVGIPHRSLALSIPTTGGAPRSATRPGAPAPWAPAPAPQIRDNAPFDFEAALQTGLRTGQGDEWLQLGHVKFFSDGALGSQTAALEEPYEGTEIAGSSRRPLELRTDVARAAAADSPWPYRDRRSRCARRARALHRHDHPPALRQRLEHIQLVREEDRDASARSA